ncbi:hypothetical protein GFY24_00635 [Nocardia sp. SYP-A9097]|uniref:recombinase zinc beta ribbon domain-containing protein n=1 Tax=Nocardia sp. SYP-A9097 TaxID=2663237 RepID=UPI00129C01CC|nr:recombinase zinc beta ribbon domain-containing protein [Nocardia sp. SYP-A9097]MRH85983.1 hypothetical protein [Nocardia sp. SYP-A9097]
MTVSRAYGWLPDGKTVDPGEASEIHRWADYLLDSDADPRPSRRGLAADLAARGVATVSGAPWSPTVLRRALVAPRMIGHRFDADGQLVDAGIEPILDRDTWQQLREKLLDPDLQKFTPSRDAIYLLSEKLARCDECGHHLTYNTSGDRAAVYECSVTGGGCGKVSITAALLEDDITERVLARLTDAKYRRQLSRALLAAGTIEQQQQTIEDLRERLAVLGRDFADRLIERETMLEGTDRARRNIAAAERLIQSMTTVGDVLAPTVDDVLAWWEEALPVRRHEIVAYLLDHVVVRSSQGRQIRGADRVDPHWRTFK